jgi:hypothetical protein
MLPQLETRAGFAQEESAPAGQRSHLDFEHLELCGRGSKPYWRQHASFVKPNQFSLARLSLASCAPARFCSACTCSAHSIASVGPSCPYNQTSPVPRHASPGVGLGRLCDALPPTLVFAPITFLN